MDKNQGNDVDFNFDEVEVGSVYGNDNSKKQIWDKLKGKGLFIVVGIIILAILLYKIFGALFGSEPAKVVAKPIPVVAQPTLSANEDKIGSKLAIIDNRTLENRNKLNDEIRMQAQLENSVRTLQTQINLINANLQDVSSQLKKLTKPPKVIKTVKVKKSIVVRPVYYVQALIPERAWLKKDDGTTVTVSRGDKLEGYGLISAIDVLQGMVLTDTGDMIGYHPNDK